MDCCERQLKCSVSRTMCSIADVLCVTLLPLSQLMYTTGQWNGTGALPAIGPTPLACNVNSPHVMSLVECRLHPSVMALVDRTLAVGRVQRSLSYVAPLKEATHLPMKVVRGKSISSSLHTLISSFPFKSGVVSFVQYM